MKYLLILFFHLPFFTYYNIEPVSASRQIQKERQQNFKVDKQDNEAKTLILDKSLPRQSKAYARIYYTDRYPWEGQGNQLVYELDCFISNWTKGLITNIELSDGVELSLTFRNQFQEVRVTFDNTQDFSSLKSQGLDNLKSAYVRYGGSSTCISKINNNLRSNPSSGSSPNRGNNGYTPSRGTPSQRMPSTRPALDYVISSMETVLSYGISHVVYIKNNHPSRAIEVKYQLCTLFEECSGTQKIVVETQDEENVYTYSDFRYKRSVNVIAARFID